MFANMSFIRDILLGAQKRKGNLNAMCDALHINPPDLFHSDIQVSFEVAYRAWEVGIEHTGDSRLGLHIGEETNTSVLGLVGHLMQSCATLEEAFTALCRFSTVTTDMFSYSISTTGERHELSYNPCTPWIRVSSVSARQAVEQAMAGTLNVFALLSGKKIFPREASFAYARPKDLSEYDDIFQAPLTPCIVFSMPGIDSQRSSVRGNFIHVKDD